MKNKPWKWLKKIRENSFDFNDFLDQMDQISKMGPLEDIMKMIPGMANNKALANVKMDPKDIAHMKAIVYSMTPQEREDPDLLNQVDGGGWLQVLAGQWLKSIG